MVGDKRITQDTKTKIENIDNTVFLSNASSWEIAIKLNIGKLKLKDSLSDLEEYLNQKGFIILEFDFEEQKRYLTSIINHYPNWISIEKVKGKKYLSFLHTIVELFVSKTVTSHVHKT